MLRAEKKVVEIYFVTEKAGLVTRVRPRAQYEEVTLFKRANQKLGKEKVTKFSYYPFSHAN